MTRRRTEHDAGWGARYFNTAYLFPPLGDNARPLHLLLAWWAILYALSMVARYESVAWTETTAISTSSEAASIEQLLDTALIRLPRLVLDVIDELT